MKINVQNKDIPLEDIPVGECFLLDGRLYIRVVDPVGPRQRCGVDLESGVVRISGKWPRVTQVNAVVTILNEESK